MSNISANSVFHFTQSLEALLGILTDQSFKVHYCTEEFRLCGRKFRYLVPMVSFCDIPLSAAQRHMRSYGSYGIGLSKTWARAAGLNPVLYLNSESNLCKSIYYEFDRRGRRTSPDVKESRFRDLLRYVKNDKGLDPRDLSKTYLFLNEREWRYTPDYEPDHDGGIQILKGMSDNEIKKLKTRLNRQIASLTLTFKISDIKYIILSKSTEIDKLLMSNQDFLVRLTKAERLRVVRSIMTASQIRLDL